MKTETRVLSEKIQALSGDSLIKIHSVAMQWVAMGTCQDRLSALKMMLEELNDGLEEA
jgi:hypothetical protein